MTARARTSRLAAVLASAALLLPLCVPVPAAARPARLKADSLAITVLDVTPTTLPTSATPKPFTVTLTVTNRTDQQLTGLRIEGERGEPVANQTQLDQAIKNRTSPAGHVVPIRPTHPVTLDLAPDGVQTVQFRSTTSTADDGGLCNCAPRDQAFIYPLYFTGHMKGVGGVDQSVGLATTFVSAFYQAPAPVHVSWLWPLIDQPHLLSGNPVGTGGPVFTDDFLAASVGVGGRLDRALAVAESVAHMVPITLVIDPELLYELELMASGPYQVQSGTKTAPGTGKPVAAAWLQRFQTLLGTAPQLRVQLTAYADPDVESLHGADLSWFTAIPASMRRLVETALAGHPAESNLVWPANGVLSRRTLTTLVGTGVSTVLVKSSSITPKTPAGSVPPGLARLSAGGHDVAAGLLDPTLQHYIQQAVAVGGPGLSVLPQLASELAIRAVQEPTTEHVVVLTPPRWVDASVDAAAKVILGTSHSLTTRPIALAEAIGGELLPNVRSRLVRVPASARTLPQTNLDTAAQLGTDDRALISLLTPRRPQAIDPGAKALLDELPLEGQRTTASAWGRPGNAQSGAAFAGALTDQLYELTHGVTIVKPSSGSYTLASDNSPLPITVHNNLPYPVTVVIRVTAANGLPGFTATPTKPEVIEARQKATVHVATNVERTGRIPVEAALLTPDGRQRIGDTVELTVRSTALGVIGLIITIVAGAVLALALIVRFGRRLRHRWTGNAPRHPHWDPDAHSGAAATPPDFATSGGPDARRAERAP